ncbi:hypothetical protein B0H14DRAFT_3557289 [Mycena olivaceomarginata]|nr:hypothetical protein B0H14DRAFT_3557289 [Mycena olivaceomarginata]
MTRAVLGVRVCRAFPHTATPTKRLQSTAVDSFSLSSAHVAPLDELIPRWKSDYSSIPSAAAALAARGLGRLNARETRTRAARPQSITWPQSASLDAPKALPMPVKIGTDEDFKDVFQFLHQNIDPKDVLSPEKQALRDELARTLGLQPGNELRWKHAHVPPREQRDEHHRRARVARFIAEHPERIETWYLAGNHIRGPAFRLLVDAMVQSPRITNVWLKRNPLTPESVPDVVRLITQTPNLRTLDLENTELGDEGVARIMREITGKALPLRNLYLNANGVGENAAAALGAYLAHPLCALESLYLDSNPLGDAGALHLAAALASKSTTRSPPPPRPDLDEPHLGRRLRPLRRGHDAPAPHVPQPRHVSDDARARAAPPTSSTTAPSPRSSASCGAPPHCGTSSWAAPPSLRRGSRPCAPPSSTPPPPTTELPLRTPRTCASSAPTAGATTPRAAPLSAPASNLDGGLRAALAANVRRLYPAAGDDYAAFLRDSLAARFLYSPEDVRLIDSVYRTRDQRGAGAGEQFWRAGDEVWGLVDADV